MNLRKAYNSKSLWLALVVALVISIFFAVVIFRDFLFSPGLLEYGDLRFHIDLNHEVSDYFSTWSAYRSGDAFTWISQYPIWQFLILLGDSYIAQRVFFVMLFTATGSIMYLVFFTLIRKGTKPFFSYVVPVIPTVVYVMNPYTVVKLNHYAYLLGYAFIPLIFLLTIRAMEKTTFRGLIASAITLSLVLFIIGVEAFNIIFSFLFILFLVVAEIVSSVGKDVVGAIKRGMVLLGTVVSFYLPLAAYWLIPWVSCYRIMRAPWEEPMTLEKSMSLCKNAGIFNVFRGTSSASISEFYRFQILGPAWIVWVVCTTVIPVITLSSILVKPQKRVIDNKYVCSILLMAVALIFFGTGVNPPFGGFYKWLLFDAPLLGGMDWIFKHPYEVMGYQIFAYAFLAGVATIRIVSLTPKKKRITLSNVRIVSNVSKIIVLGLICLIVGCSLVGAYPHLTGNDCGVISPIKLPEDYKTVNEWLKDQDGDFRVAWHPSDAYPMYLDVKWSTLARKELTPDVRTWASGKPILSLHAEQYKPLYYLLMDLLTHNGTFYIGKLYSIVGVKYVIFHNDSIEAGKYEPILTGLQQQKDLRLVKTVGDLYVFENLEEVSYVNGVENLILSVGGLDVLARLIEVDSYDPNRTPIIFVEQNGMSLENLDLLASTYNTTLLFYGTKNMSDLTLSTLDNSYLFAPYNIPLRRLAGWVKEFMSSTIWIPHYMNHQHGYVGHRYDFDMNKGIVLAYARVGIPLSVKAVQSGRNEIWVRTLMSPGGKELKFMLDVRKMTKDTETLIKEVAADAAVVAGDGQADFWTVVPLDEGLGTLGSPVLGNEPEVKKEGANSLSIKVGSGNYKYWALTHSYASGQDWSKKDFVSLYWYGRNTGVRFHLRAYTYTNIANYFEAKFYDSFSGWRALIFPLDDFDEAGKPSWSNINEVEINCDPNDAHETWYIDHIIVGNWPENHEFIGISLDGESFEFLSGGKSIGTVNTWTQSLDGFRWVRVGEVDFEDTEVHELTIMNRGFNAINMIAVVPSTILKNQKQMVSKLIQDRGVRVIYVHDRRNVTMDAETLIEEVAAHAAMVADDSQADFWTVVPLDEGLGTLGSPVLGNEPEVKKEGADSLSITVGSGNYKYWALTHDYDSSQDWSNKDFVSLYWYGRNTGVRFHLRAYTYTDIANYFEVEFCDDFSGWRALIFPLDDFDKAGEPSWSNINKVEINCDPNDAHETWYIDHIIVGNWPENHEFVRVNPGSEKFEFYLPPTDLGECGYIWENSHKIGVSYDKKQPTQIYVETSYPSPFILIYHEAYYEHWRAKVQNQKIESIPINSLINGFTISKNIGNNTIEIEYTPEKYFNLGKTVTFLSLATYILALLYIKRKASKNR